MKKYIRKHAWPTSQGRGLTACPSRLQGTTWQRAHFSSTFTFTLRKSCDLMLTQLVAFYNHSFSKHFESFILAKITLYSIIILNWWHSATARNNSSFLDSFLKPQNTFNDNVFNLKCIRPKIFVTCRSLSLSSLITCHLSKTGYQAKTWRQMVVSYKLPINLQVLQVLVFSVIGCKKCQNYLMLQIWWHTLFLFMRGNEGETQNLCPD